MRKQIKTKKFKKETKSKRGFSSREKSLWGFVGTALFYLRRKCSICILLRRGAGSSGEILVLEMFPRNFMTMFTKYLLITPWTFIFCFRSCCFQKLKSCSMRAHCSRLRKLYLFYFPWAIMIDYWISMLCWDKTKNISPLFLLFQMLYNIRLCHSTSRYSPFGGKAIYRKFVFIYLYICLWILFIYLFLDCL